MWETIGFTIKQVFDQKFPGCFAAGRYFLDAVQLRDGRRSLSNICNGEYDYCRKTMLECVNELCDTGVWPGVLVTSDGIYRKQS
jgi:hypothetical protein